MASSGCLRIPFSVASQTSLCDPCRLSSRVPLSLRTSTFKPLQISYFGFDSFSPGVQCSVSCSASGTSSPPSGRIISGPCFVVDDNIDTDQIIPAEYLTLVPSKPEEYEKLGSYAMAGLPKKFSRYVRDGETKTEYPIMIGGANFGCGSSREHAPVAMGAAGCRAVVAESYARIFFRNCVATGELYPVESEERLCERINTGDEVTVDLEHDILIHHASGKSFPLKPIGEAGPVIDAGGIFNFARASGMIAAKS